MVASISHDRSEIQDETSLELSFILIIHTIIRRDHERAKIIDSKN